MVTELVLAEIQQAFFEYRANFTAPLTIFWSGGRQAEIINALHKALTSWHVDFENISWQHSPKNLREVQLSFGVPSQMASVLVGIAGVTMTAVNPDWSRAPELIALFKAALDAIKNSTRHDFQYQQITLGFHVKPPTSKVFREVMTRFVNPKELGSDDAAMFGVSAYYSDRSFVIDNSAAIPGGVFIKLIRNFTAETQFEEMAKILYSDEESVLRRLGLRLQ